MSVRTIRTIVAVALFCFLSAGLIVGTAFGTLSGFGVGDISLLCPLGALTLMISSKTAVPRAVVSLVIMAVLVVVFGRAFCAWVCPVPLLQRFGRSTRSADKRKAEQQEKERVNRQIARFELDRKAGRACGECAVRAHEHPKVDSRHAVGLAAVASAAIFGFPVFCLVCPIGLTFATVLLVYRLFAFGDVGWTVVVVSALLVLELTVLRKWCTRLCPMAGLVNLLGRFSRTGQPQIDDAKCIETTKGKPCSKCADVCDYDVNLRHAAYGELPLVDCARCLECVQACPAHAIRVPLVNERVEKEGRPD